MNKENINNGKVGLLPFYLEMYDEIMPEIRKGFGPFLDIINDKFKSGGIKVVRSEICRLSVEFEDAVNRFEKEDVDCILTIHLAYSPSLESVNTLVNTKLPIIILDTTRDECFDSISQLMYNHGIHGVQDMCNLLLRRGKGFIIEAGHINSSEFVDKIVSHIKGTVIARKFKNARVAQVGTSFSGMGDFVVDNTVMEDLGIKVFKVLPNEISKFMPEENDPMVLDEILKDIERFDCSHLRPGQLESAVKTGLALRRWIEKENIMAFTINFRAITKESGFTQMPFLEICKAMGNGIGYAGEGDVITAALVGALAQVLGDVSFIEMFCPDWKENLIFISHMGEMNINLSENSAVLLEKEWSFTDAGSPVCPSACFKEGEALFVNLAPGPDNSFSLILSPVKMMGEMHRTSIGDGIRGWMKPKMPLPAFLKKFSEAGGTHHSALVYGNPVEELKTFGKIMNWKIIEIN